MFPKSEKSRVAILILVFVILAGATIMAQEVGTQKTPTPAAKVGQEIISLEEVQQALQQELTQIELQRFNLLEQKLDQLIAERLLAGEAKKRGARVEALLQEEVTRKAPKVTDEEVTDFITKNRNSLSQVNEAELRFKVWEYLQGQKVAQQRTDYIRALRAKAGVMVYLQEPASVRVQVDPNKGFVRGPKDAPVAIVEFSDFQCPFCKAVVPTIHQVMAQYAGKVRWVFRDFPIPSLHPLAPKAHEAARCAAEQGKFWEYHDLLFERSPRLTPAELKQYARELKLNGENFEKCFDSGKYQPAIASDVQEGAKLGATGTPTFFINGRILVGAQPISAFQKIIESEFARKSAQ